VTHPATEGTPSQFTKKSMYGNHPRPIVASASTVSGSAGRLVAAPKGVHDVLHCVQNLLSIRFNHLYQEPDDTARRVKLADISCLLRWRTGRGNIHRCGIRCPWSGSHYRRDRWFQRGQTHRDATCRVRDGCSPWKALP
jgi:hypothetical protein